MYSKVDSTVSLASDELRSKARPAFFGWPSEPRVLSRGGFLVVFGSISDILIIFISWVFFVYGVAIVAYDGTPASDVPRLGLLKDGARYGPTVFPILFAAIVGQAMHAIALWRLEHGECVKVLDQLMGSTAIFATVITQLKVRRMGILGVILILLWSLSPVGGQASLRVLEFKFVEARSEALLYYLNLNSTWLPGFEGDFAPNQQIDRSIMTALIQASLMAPLDMKESPRDLWGNVKVPMLEPASKDAIADENGWYALSNLNRRPSALVGLPTSSLGTDSNYTFQLESSYLNLECGSVEYETNRSAQDIWFNGNDTEQMDAFYDAATFSVQNTCYGIQTDGNAGWRHGTPGPGEPVYSHGPTLEKYMATLPLRNVSYNARENPLQGSQFTVASCTARQTHVEFEVFCMGRNCTSSRVRESRLYHAPPAYTFLDYIDKSFFQDMGALDLCDRRPKPGPFQRYIGHPADPFNSSTSGPDAWTAGPEIFGQRLSQLFNTFIMAGMGLEHMPTGFPGNIPGGSPSPNVIPGGMVSSNTTVNISSNTLTLSCNRTWLAFLLIATSVMFSAGILGLVLQFMRKAPDLAMNISTMTRDNPFVAVPDIGSAMDSDERMRLMRDIKVRLGDIRGMEPVGYVAVASYEEGEEDTVLNLREGRLYA